MGLAVGLAWIIIGIVYVAYKFFNEELRMSSLNAWITICIIIIGLFITGSVLKVVTATDIGLIIIQSIVGIGACVFLVNVVKWETESYKDSLKEEQLPSEVTKENVRDQAQRVRHYRDGLPAQNKYTETAWKRITSAGILIDAISREIAEDSYNSINSLHCLTDLLGEDWSDAVTFYEDGTFTLSAHVIRHTLEKEIDKMIDVPGDTKAAMKKALYAAHKPN